MIHIFLYIGIISINEGQILKNYISIDKNIALVQGGSFKDGVASYSFSHFVVQLPKFFQTAALSFCLDFYVSNDKFFNQLLTELFRRGFLLLR